MMNRNKELKWLVKSGLIFSILTLIGCGGGGSGGGSDQPAVLTGVLVDSPIAGVSYKTATQAGKTTVDGEYKYLSGEQVSFTIGSIQLGKSVAAKSKVTPLDLTGESATSDTATANMAQFLQSLDVDSNPTNGIVIDDAAHIAAASGMNVDFSSPSFDTDPDVVNVVSNGGGGGVLITEQDAIDHLNNTLITGGGTQGGSTQAQCNTVDSASGATLADFDAEVAACRTATGTGRAFTNADLAGKTWVSLVDGSSVTFSATDDTGSSTENGVTSTFTWSINAKGQLVVSEGMTSSTVEIIAESGVQLSVKGFDDDLGEIWNDLVELSVTSTPSVVATLPCNTESGFDDAADGGLGRPVNPHSFADFEAVIAGCGTAQAFTVADVSGKTFQEVGTIETMTFNAGTGTAAAPASGVYDDGAGMTIAFQWYVEAATCAGCDYNYLVIYSDTTIDPSLPLAWLRDTAALIGVTGTPGVSGAQYAYVKYTEQSNYSDSSRAASADGEIWNSVDRLQ